MFGNEMEEKVLTMQELAARFKDKYAEIEALDHYGVSIDLHRVAVELSDEGDELYFFSTDFENRPTGSICIAEDSIESIIEKEDGSYTMHFCLEMASVNISEDKISEQLEKAFAEKRKENFQE